MADATPHIDPGRAALLVMDYQPAIVGRVPDPDGLLERAATAIATARAQGVTIGYVRVAFEDGDYDAIPPTNKTFSAMAGARPMNDDAPETQVHEQVAPQAGDIIVRKVRVGAFSTTDLHEQLASRGIDTLILAGISTSGVVLSTVRDGADRDYALYVLSDAVADFDPDVHEVLVSKVFPRQAHVITTDELPDLISAGEREESPRGR